MAVASPFLYGFCTACAEVREASDWRGIHVRGSAMTFNGDAQLESGERLLQTGDAPQRRWERLPIAIPIFVRGLDENGKSFVEFSTATNLNAGGMLLLSRRSFPAGQEITLEIPTPTPQLIPAGQDSVKSMSATILYAQNDEGIHLCGVRFSTPLLPLPGDDQ